MRGVKRIVVLTAIAAAFIAGAPDAKATPHVDTSGWTKAELRHYVRSLEHRNARQASLILSTWIEVDALKAAYAPFREASPVTLATLNAWQEAGIGFGQVYVTP